jgi:hypothetical protein
VNCLTTEIKQKETFREGEKRLKEEMEGWNIERSYRRSKLFEMNEGEVK